MNRTSDYFFDLPAELIAQYPSQKRDESRLMHIDRQSKKISHHIFKDIHQFLGSDDVLVLNNTKVIPSRLFTLKPDTGAKIEVFLLRQLIGNTWEALIKPTKKVKNTEYLVLNDCKLWLQSFNEDSQSYQIRFEYDGDIDEFIRQHGHQPLPPYIRREDELEDQTRYQTVYAKYDGAVAAPTAGLHFTDDVLRQIKENGTEIIPITLHVGLGTFRPVVSDVISDHQMHSEYYEISRESAAQLNSAISNQKNMTCVGTTSVRTLESAVQNNQFTETKNTTDIFITPGYEFKVVDKLITNFHTPESTLMMLVSAFADYDLIMQAYAIAIQEKYRFFSYGDSMIIT